MNELTIHDYLKAKGLNEYGIAGLMGNLFAESVKAAVTAEYEAYAAEEAAEEVQTQVVE